MKRKSLTPFILHTPGGYRKCRACGDEVPVGMLHLIERVTYADGVEVIYLHNTDMCAGADREDRMLEDIENQLKDLKVPQ